MIPSPVTISRLDDELGVLDVLLHALAAGRPLPDALGEAAREHPGRRLRPRLGIVEDALRSGGTLSDGLARAGLSRTTAVAARAGEASGRLAESLEAAEALIEAELETRRRTIDAWAQSLLTLAVAAATIVLLALAGTLPLFIEMLESPSRALSALRWITGLPQPIPALLAVALVVLATLGIGAALRSDRASRLLERLPWTGELRRQQHQAFALRELATLVRSGVAVQDALDIVAAGLPESSSARGNLVALASSLRDGAAPAAPRGWPLLQALIESPAARADLPALIGRAADWHAAEVDRLADEAASVAGVVATFTVAVTCGTLLVIAWGGYFSLATRAGG